MNAKTEHRLTGMLSVALLLAVVGTFIPSRANADTIDYSYIAPMTSTKVAEIIEQDEMQVGQLVVFPSAGGLRHLSSDFGYRTQPCDACSSYHRGADFTTGYGSKVYATTYGKVVDVGWHGGEGFSITIKHYADNGFANTKTVYAHLIDKSNKVRTGDWVIPGQVIGKMGTTGVTTAPHLHFEVRINGEAIDPVAWLKKNGAKNP